jgi:hypothetical protein
MPLNVNKIKYYTAPVTGYIKEMYTFSNTALHYVSDVLKRSQYSASLMA